MPQLTHLDPHLLAEPLRVAIENAPLPSLGVDQVDQGLAELLGGELLTELSLSAAQRSALWLLAGDLDASHEISQSLGSPLGSFWHGVMHRREGDYGNAKYWFRRAGSMPFYSALASAVDEDPLANAALTRGAWDAEHFVDLCQRAARKPASLTEACRMAQWIEWQVAWLA